MHHHNIDKCETWRKTRFLVLCSYKVNTVLEFTSCAFLLITLLVYVCLPSLQNLHGKTLMCHVSSLLFAFTCLAVIPWITPGVALNIKELRVTILCKALGERHATLL